MNAEQLFGTSDLYKILKIDREAPICEGNYYSIMYIVHCFHIDIFCLVKRNYYKLALKYHPDRVSET